ncbi:MAG: GNAT family N-acetyltransferase [Oscillospiraceae bacterium]|nr:GNAT family N-acetyltransferase [Oscillospiraceae bacterium]
MLFFAGRGSAFAKEHNSAFFIEKQELVLLDCPVSAFQKYKTLNFDSIERIYILVTHTHGDHVGGIGLMIQYMWFAVKKKIPVTVVAPSERVRKNLYTLLTRIEGCEKDWFKLLRADELQKDWLIQAISTTHATQLEGKCFGWHLKVNHKNIIYTGDTATLKPYLPYLKKGSILYTEISYYQKKSDENAVHLSLEEMKPVLLNFIQNGIEVYLMHLDNEKKIMEEIQGTKIKLAPLYPFRKQFPIRLVRMNSSELSKAKYLYEQAFPQEEQAPFALLCIKHHFADVDVLSIYAGKQWAGFFYIVNYKNLSYLFYFAVRPEFRGKGIGSQALQRLKKFYQGRKLFLAIEQIHKNVSNYEDRVSRKNFYLNQGFQELHRNVQEGNVIYELLSIGGDVTPEEYRNLIRSFTGRFLYHNITMKVLENE